jgi:hypothetical protein
VTPLFDIQSSVNVASRHRPIRSDWTKASRKHPECTDDEPVRVAKIGDLPGLGRVWCPPPTTFPGCRTAANSRTSPSTPATSQPPTRTEPSMKSGCTSLPKVSAQTASASPLQYVPTTTAFRSSQVRNTSARQLAELFSLSAGLERPDRKISVHCSLEFMDSRHLRFKE